MSRTGVLRTVDRQSGLAASVVEPARPTPGGTRVVNLATSETLHVPARCAARWNRTSSMVVGVSTKGEDP